MRSFLRSKLTPVVILLPLATFVLFQNCGRSIQASSEKIPIDLETPGRALAKADPRAVAIAFVFPVSGVEIAAPDGSYIEWISQNAPQDSAVEVDVLQNGEIVQSAIGALSFRGMDTYGSIELNTMALLNGGNFQAHAKLLDMKTRAQIAEAWSTPFLVRSVNGKTGPDFSFELASTQLSSGTYSSLKVNLAFAPVGVRLSTIDLYRGDGKVMTLLENMDPRLPLDIFIPDDITPGTDYHLKGTLTSASTLSKVIGDVLSQEVSESFTITAPRSLLSLDLRGRQTSFHAGATVQLNWKTHDIPEGVFFTYIGIQKVQAPMTGEEALKTQPIRPVAWVRQYEPVDAGAEFALPAVLAPGHYQFVVILEREAAGNSRSLLEIARVIGPAIDLLP